MHLPLQQFDDQSMIDGLFQNITWIHSVGAESWWFTSVKLASSVQISFLKYFKS